MKHRRCRRSTHENPSVIGETLSSRRKRSTPTHYKFVGRDRWTPRRTHGLHATPSFEPVRHSMFEVMISVRRLRDMNTV